MYGVNRALSEETSDEAEHPLTGMGRTRVKKREKREIKLFTNKRKRKRVRGDYCIEPYSSLSTGSTRMAILHLCCIRWIA